MTDREALARALEEAKFGRVSAYEVERRVLAVTGPLVRDEGKVKTRWRTMGGPLAIFLVTQ